MLIDTFFINYVIELFIIKVILFITQNEKFFFLC